MSEDLIKSIQELINSGKGDTGRLRYILHTIQNGKNLYNSDRKYLEKLFSVQIPVISAKQVRTQQYKKSKGSSGVVAVTIVIIITLGLVYYMSGEFTQLENIYKTPLEEKAQSIQNHILSLSVEGFFSWFYSLSFWDLVKILIFPVIVDYSRSFGKATFLLFYSIKEKKTKKMMADLHPDFKITLMIPAHNEEAGIRHALEAAINTTYSNKEIIVIDDGSTDNTYKIVQEFAQKKLVKLIRREQASGSKAAALNFGSQYATGEIIMSIDADTLIERKSLDEMLKFFVNEKVIAVSGNIRIQSGDNNITNFLTRLQSYEYMVNMEMGRRYNAILNSLLIISGAFGAFRRQVFSGVGMYDKDTVTEDFDLTVKIRKFGGRLAFATDAVALTYCPNNWKTWWRQRFRWSQGQMITMLKHKDIAWTGGYDFPLIAAFYDMWIMDVILLAIRFVWFPVLLWQFTADLFYLFALVFMIYLASEAFVFISAGILSPRKQDLKFVYLVPVMVFFYRPLYSLLRFKAYVSTLFKKETQW